MDLIIALWDVNILNDPEFLIHIIHRAGSTSIKIWKFSRKPHYSCANQRAICIVMQ